MTTIKEEIDELERELAVRRRVYPEWIVRQKINRSVADKRIKCLEHTIARLKNIEKQMNGSQTKLL